MRKLTLFVVAFIASSAVSANCKQTKMMAGEWQIELSGSGIAYDKIDDYEGVFDSGLSTENGDQFGITGKVKFNKFGKLTSGSGGSVLEAVMSSNVGLDQDSYAGWKIDMNAKDDEGYTYTYWKKGWGTCYSNADLHIVSNNTIGGEIWNITQCGLTSVVSRNKQTAMLWGLCSVDYMMADGTSYLMLVPVDGRLQRKQYEKPN